MNVIQRGGVRKITRASAWIKRAIVGDFETDIRSSEGRPEIEIYSAWVTRKSRAYSLNPDIKIVVVAAGKDVVGRQFTFVGRSAKIARRGRGIIQHVFGCGSSPFWTNQTIDANWGGLSANREQARRERTKKHSDLHLHELYPVDKKMETKTPGSATRSAKRAQCYFADVNPQTSYTVNNRAMWRWL
jgi:hypothetical protein